ncbi:hypothetical protein NDU88_011821, partial [Pleurodeles waltl]
HLKGRKGQHQWRAQEKTSVPVPPLVQMCWPHRTDHLCRGQWQHQCTRPGSSQRRRTGGSRGRP